MQELMHGQRLDRDNSICRPRGGPTGRQEARVARAGRECWAAREEVVMPFWFCALRWDSSWEALPDSRCGGAPGCTHRPSALLVRTKGLFLSASMWLSRGKLLLGAPANSLWLQRQLRRAVEVRPRPQAGGCQGGHGGQPEGGHQ